MAASLPYRLAGLPFRAAEKPFIAGVERTIFFLWDSVDLGSAFCNCSDETKYPCTPNCHEIYTDLSHHLQSIGVQEVVTMMTQTITEDRFCVRKYEKYPFCRFSKWTDYDNLQGIPLHYEDTSRQTIALGSVADLQLVSPKVLKVVCHDPNNHGIGGMDFIRDQLSRHCQIEGPASAETTMHFVLPPDTPHELERQLALVQDRYQDIRETLGNLFNNSNFILRRAKSHAHLLSVPQQEHLRNERRLIWEAELNVRQQMAALTKKVSKNRQGEDDTPAMISKYQNAMEEDLALTETERVEAAASQLQEGYELGLERLQNVLETVEGKVVGDLEVPLYLSARTAHQSIHSS